MPYTTQYVDDGKGVHKLGSGILTGAEIFVSAMQRASDEERARKIRYGLVDFSEVTEFRLTPEDIRRIVEMNRKAASYSPGEVVAIIAPCQMSYALARMWHLLSEDLGWERNVFHNRDDALAWLRKQLLPRDGARTDALEFPSLKP